MQLSQLEQEEILSEQKAFMNTLKRRPIELFKESSQLRKDYLRLRLKWTEEVGKGEVLILLFMTLADISKPQSMELHQAGYTIV